MHMCVRMRVLRAQGRFRVQDAEVGSGRCWQHAKVRGALRVYDACYVCTHVLFILQLARGPARLTWP